MNQSFYNIEDVFAGAERIPRRKERQLLRKIDRIERRLSAKMVASHEEYRKIMAETCLKTQKTYVM